MSQNIFMAVFFFFFWIQLISAKLLKSPDFKVVGKHADVDQAKEEVKVTISKPLSKISIS